MKRLMCMVSLLFFYCALHPAVEVKQRAAAASASSLQLAQPAPAAGGAVCISIRQENEMQSEEEHDAERQLLLGNAYARERESRQQLAQAAQAQRADMNNPEAQMSSWNELVGEQILQITGLPKDLAKPIASFAFSADIFWKYSDIRVVPHAKKAVVMQPRDSVRSQHGGALRAVIAYSDAYRVWEDVLEGRDALIKISKAHCILVDEVIK
jgi:hypothetical protein